MKLIDLCSVYMFPEQEVELFDFDSSEHIGTFQVRDIPAGYLNSKVEFISSGCNPDKIQVVIV